MRDDWEYHQDSRDRAAGLGAVGLLVVAIIVVAAMLMGAVLVLDITVTGM